MLILAAHRSFDLTRRRWAETPRVPVDPLTDALVLRLLRPPKRSQIKTSLILCVDGEEYVCSGRLSGWRTGAYELRYHPGALRRDGRIVRLGELARHTSEAYVRLEVLRGDATVDLLAAWVTAALAPPWPIHNSVAFDAATSALEVAGDGVLSLTHTPIGSSSLGAFAASMARFSTLSTSCTYAGTAMTEIWDVEDTGEFATNAGYHWPGGSTLPAGAQTVTSTLASAPAVSHGLVVITMTGVHQTTPVGTPATAIGGATSPATVTVGDAGSDDMVVDAFCGQSTDITIGADQTERDRETSDSVRLAVSTQSGASGGVMSWSLTGPDFWTTGAVAFKAVAAGIGAAEFMAATTQFAGTGGMVGRVYA